MADTNGGMAALARVLQNRTNEIVSANSEVVIDFGTIQDDYSLMTNLYPYAIKRGDYAVTRSLQLGSAGGTLTTTADGVAVLIPESMRGISPGDRVLVAWSKSTPVVIDLI